MAEYKQHVPGSPCWAELATTDEEGALAFYGSLFGWQDAPQPMGREQLYHMQKIRGFNVAAVCRQSKEENRQGVRPHWRVCFATDSADNVAARAAQAGGIVVVPAFDVFGLGRMTVLQDPQGAVASFWQAKEHIGYKLVQEPGVVIWNELRTTNSQEAAAFYKVVLPADIDRFPGPMDYFFLKILGQKIAGIMGITREMGPVPAHWLVHFHVADVEKLSEMAAALNGKIMLPARDTQDGGRFAILHDPQGAVFGVFTPNT